MMKNEQITITPGSMAAFNNQVDYCIGTGRMGLALHQEYLEELAYVQKEIGFSYIRGHGLFSDDMAIYQEDRNGNPEYCFTYLDRVMDSYRRLHIRPFLELGFMPQKLASGTQTIFYWKGNTTPPAEMKRWTDLVQATLRHLICRYGKAEVETWPIEVWNEPNLPGFWENADMHAYFKLFAATFAAIKAVDPALKAGGPAICGVNDDVWMLEFCRFCKENHIRPDFFTRHHYNTEVPEINGHYGYAELTDPQVSFSGLEKTREIIDSFPEFTGAPIHVTEFNTSYIPNCPLHDTNQNAAYIAGQLSRLGDWNASYSYWTFGDVFEENGVPFSLFHGGFGLTAAGCIPKPTFWAFAFFAKLKGEENICVFRDDHSVLVQTPEGYRGVCWNACLLRQDEDLELQITLPFTDAPSGAACSLLTKTVDETSTNPLKVWHDLGEPANPSDDELEIIRCAAYPAISTARLPILDNHATLTIPVKENAVVYFEAKANVLKPDSGYDYSRVMQYSTIQ